MLNRIRNLFGRPSRIETAPKIAPIELKPFVGGSTTRGATKPPLALVKQRNRRANRIAHASRVANR